MLGQLTRQDQADGCLDFPRRDGGLLVVSSQLGGLGSNTLENVWGLVSIVGLKGALSGSDSPLTNEFRIDMARLEIPVSG